VVVVEARDVGVMVVATSDVDEARTESDDLMLLVWYPSRKLHVVALRESPRTYAVIV
jgi:hypothetical protein